jgi:hypothetical protein
VRARWSDLERAADAAEAIKMKKTLAHRLFRAGAAPVAAAAMLALASGSALAGTYVAGALPAEFGGGFIPPDPSVLKNVQKANAEAAKLAASIEKCYSKGAANFSKAKADGVDACLNDPSKGVLPKYHAKIAGIVGKAPGLPPCFDFAGAGDAVANIVKGFNPQTYCDGGPPASCSKVVVTITTSFASTEGSGITTQVDYPETKADIPGGGNEASVQARVVNQTGINTGTFSSGDNDTDVPTNLLDDRLSVGLISISTPISAGAFAQATFDCKPGQVPAQNDFSCTFDGGDLEGNTIPGSCALALSYVP